MIYARFSGDANSKPIHMFLLQNYFNWRLNREIKTLQRKRTGTAAFLNIYYMRSCFWSVQSSSYSLRTQAVAQESFQPGEDDNKTHVTAFS